MVSFLGYYDLGGLELTSKLFSSVAQMCAGTSRLFDFSGFSFDIYDSTVCVCRLERFLPDVCDLELDSDEGLAEFICEAFRNCTVGRLALRQPQKHVLHAFSVVAHTVTTAEKLVISRLVR